MVLSILSVASSVPLLPAIQKICLQGKRVEVRQYGLISSNRDGFDVCLSSLYLLYQFYLLVTPSQLFHIKPQSFRLCSYFMEVAVMSMYFVNQSLFVFFLKDTRRSLLYICFLSVSTG